MCVCVSCSRCAYYIFCPPKDCGRFKETSSTTVLKGKCAKWKKKWLFLWLFYLAAYSSFLGRQIRFSLLTTCLPFGLIFILFYSTCFFLNHKIQPVKRNIHLNIQGSDAEMRMLTYALRWPAPFIRSSNKYSVRFCFYLCWCCCCCFRKYIIYNAID